MPFNEETINLALIKINEIPEKHFKKEDLFSFIENLDSKLNNLNEKEILAVLKSGQEVKLLEMIRLIKHKVLKTTRIL